MAEFDAKCDIKNSDITDTTGHLVGIGTTSPAATLDVKGAADLRGVLTLENTGTATASAGFNSQPLDSLASAFDSAISTAVNQHFRWQAEPVGNNTSSPAGKFNLLFASGAGVPAETGLSVSSKGLFTFASGQKFPGTGTVTSVASGAGLTGGPITTSGTLSIATGGVTNALLQHPSLTVTAGTDLTGGGAVALGGSVTLNLDTTKVPQLNANNSFTGNEMITGVLIANGVTGTSSTSANGVLGQSFSGTGVEGDSFNGTGILGQATANSGLVFGVEGISSSPGGPGVVGLGVNESTTGSSEIGLFPTGVAGDTGQTGIGLLGTVDDGGAIVGMNNSPSGFDAGFFVNNESSVHNLPVLVAQGSFGHCTIDTDGNLSCSGMVSPVVPVDNGQRQVKLYAVEAPQNWFEDFGSGELADGAATVALEPTFAQTVDTVHGATDYHVFLTPEGDCHGLYVSNKTPTGFEVHELGGGSSNVAFDYRIVALRRGYENVRLEDVTERMKKDQANRERLLRKNPSGHRLALPVPPPQPPHAIPSGPSRAAAAAPGRGD